MDPRLLALGLACVDVAMAAVSWLILLCTYPDFARWEAAEFARHHEDYTRKVGRVVGPLLLLQLGGHAWLVFSVGGKFGNGKQWQSWISIDDEIGAIEHLLTANVSGAVNLTAPNPVTNAEFTKVLASVLKRPAIVPVPTFAPKILLGGELADALLFTGQRVIPAALNASGYMFKHTTLESAFRSLLSK